MAPDVRKPIPAPTSTGTAVPAVATLTNATAVTITAPITKEVIPFHRSAYQSRPDGSTFITGLSPQYM